MTYFLNCRAQPVAGGIVDPYVLQGDGTGTPPRLLPVAGSDLRAAVAGRNVLIATHGFNVSYQRGACSLGNLETYLHGQGVLTGLDVFIGLLWPGDFWIPAINYPFEGTDAIECGRRVAIYCSAYLDTAQSISFVSHSLGARVVLQAVVGLSRRARSVCLTAAAINRDCLATEYARAAARCDAISILSSRKDMVLKLAYPAGDFIADLLHTDHQLLTSALGYNGPPPPAAPPIRSPWQIDDSEGQDHGDYLPPSDGPIAMVPPPEGKWPRAAGFMGRAYRGDAQTWPF